MHHTQLPDTILSDKVCSARPLAGSSSVAFVLEAQTSLVGSCDSFTLTSNWIGDVQFDGHAATNHYLSNQQYSITAATTSTGSVAERYAYSAYGQPTFLDASGTPLTTQTSTLNARYLYTGREWDATLGLYHFRARWMSTTTGRFLGRDPIGFKGNSTGIYTYVGSSPLSFNDPHGLKWEIADFFNHYWRGWGRGVTLTETGLLSDFLAGVSKDINQQFMDGLADGNSKLNCDQGPGGYSETVVWRSPPDLYWETGMWPLGGTPVNVTRSTTVSWNCEQCECSDTFLKITFLNIDTTLDIHVHDAWTNPYAILEGDDVDAAANNGTCCYGCYQAYMSKYPYFKAKYDDCVADCDRRYPHKGNAHPVRGGRPYGITEDIQKSKSWSVYTPCDR